MELITTVHVPLDEAEYDIVIGEGVHDAAGRLWPAEGKCARGAVIYPANLLKECQRASESLRIGGWQLDELEIPDGEASKNLDTAGQLCSRLADFGHDRASTIFAFGGGVVGDLAGFVSAIYMRGVSFAQIPTTLLAQVDASVGGKVAVDLSQGKNLVGAFHQPRVVLMDTGVLRTLPDRHLRSGLAEVIKHACISDRGLFDFVRGNLSAIFMREPKVIQHLLVENCRIKTDVVIQDPYDHGLRGLLNLGHTVGHALEAAATDWSLHHGEAVAVGMVAEGRIAVELGLLNSADLNALREVLQLAGLATTVPATDIPKAIAALKLDKKSHGNTVTLPILRCIGRAELHDVNVERVIDALTWAIEKTD